MSTSDNGNRNEGAGKRPIDHLRALVSTVIEREIRHQEPTPQPEGNPNPSEPFRGRNSTQGNDDDKTLKFIIAGAGSVVMLILLILGLSQEHQHRPKSESPAIGQAPQTAANKNASNSGIVPRISMQPTPPDSEKKGKLTAQDLENTVAPTATAPGQSKTPTSSQPRTLGQIAPFNSEQATADSWSPKPYTGQQDQTDAQLEKVETAALAKPSLVFVANTSETTGSSGANSPLTPSLDLGTGARLWAHLASVVTTAVDVPVIAVIDYNYERDGEIVVPAGTKAVGHVQQADRSGYILIKFDRLEMPHSGVVPIDAVATNRNLGPLKGKVTGTHTGRQFLARSSSDIGSGLAMFAGQNNASGAISEDDVLRAELAQNVGNAGDQEIMQLTMSEHAIVTVPAQTDIFVVFEKTESKATGASIPARNSEPSLNELRQLLELQRQLSQGTMNNAIAQP